MLLNKRQKNTESAAVHCVNCCSNLCVGIERIGREIIQTSNLCVYSVYSSVLT